MREQSGHSILDPNESDFEDDNSLIHKKLGILFDFIDNIVENALVIQKQFIFDNINKEQNTDLENWNKLLDFGISDNKIHNHCRILRQDKIKNGVFSDYTEMDLFQIAPLIKYVINYLFHS